jgi:hypothetical protein
MADEKDKKPSLIELAPFEPFPPAKSPHTRYPAEFLDSHEYRAHIAHQLEVSIGNQILIEREINDAINRIRKLEAALEELPKLTAAVNKLTEAVSDAQIEARRAADAARIAAEVCKVLGSRLDVHVNEAKLDDKEWDRIVRRVRDVEKQQRVSQNELRDVEESTQTMALSAEKAATVVAEGRVKELELKLAERDREKAEREAAEARRQTEKREDIQRAESTHMKHFVLDKGWAIAAGIFVTMLGIIGWLIVKVFVH